MDDITFHRMSEARTASGRYVQYTVWQARRGARLIAVNVDLGVLKRLFPNGKKWVDAESV